METGVRLALSCLLLRLWGLLASLTSAHRNVSTKNTAQQQTLANTIGPITLRYVPWLQSHETRSTSIRTQVRPKCDPTPSNLHIQVRDTCDFCEIVRAVFSHEKEYGVSRQSRTQARYRCLRPTEGERGSSGTIHPPPQRITRVRGKPRSCHA